MIKRECQYVMICDDCEDSITELTKEGLKGYAFMCGWLVRDKIHLCPSCKEERP